VHERSESEANDAINALYGEEEEPDLSEDEDFVMGNSQDVLLGQHLQKQVL
jgi:hypothetical protein